MREPIILLLFSACGFAPMSGGGSSTPDAATTGSTAKLTVTAAGPMGSGTVWTTDHAIACGVSSGQCTNTYAVGTSITLNTTITNGFALAVSWPGCSPSSATCTFTITQDMTVDASFSTILYTLRISGSSHGSVSSSDGFINCGTSCLHDYALGASITLTATPTGSNSFDQWHGGPCDMSQNPTCTITMQAGAMTMSASFMGPD
jgi:hypothetical protein